jgi:hypothetical protein
VKMFNVFGLRVDVEGDTVGVGETSDVLVLTLVVEAVDLGWIVDADTLVLLKGGAVGSDSDLDPIPVEVGKFFSCASCCRHLRASTSRGSSTVWK